MHGISNIKFSSVCMFVCMYVCMYACVYVPFIRAYMREHLSMIHWKLTNNSQSLLR